MKPAHLASLLLVALAGQAPGCAELPELSRGTCGNGVIDTGEDCDTFASSSQSCVAPGKSGQCRFSCRRDDGTAASCPAGYGCGTDLLCRAPTGSFAPSDQTTELGGRSLEVADFDGDGRGDLLSIGEPDLTGLASARIVYFDADAKVAQQTIFPTLLRSAWARDLDGDGVDDLIGSVDLFRGVQVFKGSRERAFSPTAYPSFNLPKGSRMRVYAADVLSGDGFAGDEVILVGTYAMGAATFTAIHENGDEPAGLLDSLGESVKAIAVLPAPIEQLSVTGTGKVRVCLNALDPTCDCPWIYWSYKESPDVQLLQLCRKKAGGTIDFNRTDKPGGTPIVPPVKLTFPKPLTRMFLGDANGDGLPDVIGSTKGTAYIAYGDGKGSFFGTSALGSPGQVETLPIPNPLADGKEQDADAELIAVGRLDRDAHSDLVTSRGIFLLGSTGACPGKPLDKTCQGLCPASEKACTVVANFGGLWTDAVIDDLNGNGAPDVLVGSSESSGLTFYNGSGLGVFTQANLPTDAPVRHFTPGDFDGDYITDVALTQIGNHDPALGTTGDTVAILFGKASVPERPVEVARFAKVAELQRALLANGFLFDLADDLGVVSISEDDRDTSVALLFGSADRRPLAPLALNRLSPNPKEALDQGAVRTVVADLNGDGVRDVAALGATFPGSGATPEEQTFHEPRWWSLLNSRGTAIAVADVSGAMSFNPIALGFTTLAATGDLDGDGREEIVVAGSRINSLQKTELSIVAASGETAKLSERATGTIPRYAPQGHPMKLLDVDGDGQLDLVLLTRELTSSSQLQLAPTELTIVWGQAGSLDFASPTILPAPRGVLYAFGARRAATGRELVVFGDSGTYLPRRTGRALEFGDAAFAGGDGGAVADLDGDGVDDLAVLSKGALRVHTGKAVLP